jgi:hypothetical protein
MSLPPDTTPAPTSVLVPGTSPAPKASQPDSEEPGSRAEDGDKDAFEIPKIRFEIRDLSHAGASLFLSAVEASSIVTSSIQTVLRSLYLSPSNPTTTAPPTRSVTLILRDMSGVAYTTGTELDNDHKEVHFSLHYIAGIKPERLADELTGVIVHELVHCFQYNGLGTCPGGLIEGVADWVRLRRGLAPPHWKRHADGKWDGGYERTAYFLDYLEERFGEGTVRRLNEKLRVQRYEEKAFWTELVGRPVEQLWADYGLTFKDDDDVVVDQEDASSEDAAGTPSSSSTKSLIDQG